MAAKLVAMSHGDLETISDESVGGNAFAGLWPSFRKPLIVLAVGVAATLIAGIFGMVGRPSAAEMERNGQRGTATVTKVRTSWLGTHVNAALVGSDETDRRTAKLVGYHRLPRVGDKVEVVYQVHRQRISMKELNAPVRESPWGWAILMGMAAAACMTFQFMRRA